MTKSNKNRGYMTRFSITWCNLNKKWNFSTIFYIKKPSSFSKVFYKINGKLSFSTWYSSILKKNTIECISFHFYRLYVKKPFLIFNYFLQTQRITKLFNIVYTNFMQKTDLIFKHFMQNNEKQSFLPHLHQFDDKKQ